MLDDYKVEQPIVYKILKNVIDNDKLSHAYIFETNGYENIDNFVIAFVKAILCPNHSNISGIKCECDICKQIEQNEFIEFKKIDVDGNTIKKSEMDELQKEFSNKPVIGKKKVYVINNAEKLNISSSNSILKFLEEPEEGIIAILIVDNIYQLLDTIISRCQIVSFIKKEKMSEENNILVKISKIFSFNNEEYGDFIKNDKIIDYVNEIIKFIICLENNKTDAFISEATNISTFFNNTNDMQFLIYVMIAFYKDVINYKLNLKKEYFTSEFFNNIEKISNKNKIQQLCSKVSILLKLKTEINYNANMNLLIDRLIVLFEGV